MCVYNDQRSLLFVVVPTLIKRKLKINKMDIFTDYNDKIKTKNVEVSISFTCFSNVKRFNSLVFI